MIYTVVWLPAAEQELAEIWLRASDRRAVTQASDRIERTLRRDAHLKGQPIGNGRVYVDDPLRVRFTVSPNDCLVTITWVEES